MYTQGWSLTTNVVAIPQHEDAMAAVRFMRTQGFDRVVMIGTSIGAVSCLLAAHHLKQAVVGVVAENPFTTIQANVDGLVHKIAFQRVLLRQNKPLMWLCSPVRRTVARLTIWRIMRLLGPNATRRDVHAINIMAGLAPRPVLLMHGTEDRLIDHRHTVELAEQVGGLHAVVLPTLRLHGLPIVAPPHSLQPAHPRVLEEALEKVEDGLGPEVAHL